MSDNVPEAQQPAPTNGSHKSGCSPAVLAAIYGDPKDKKEAYENSLRRWDNEHQCLVLLTVLLLSALSHEVCLAHEILNTHPAAGLDAGGGRSTQTEKTTKRTNMLRIRCYMTETTCRAPPLRLIA